MPADNSDSRPWSLRNGYFAASLYLALTLLMTFPLAVSWRSALPAGSGDIWQNYWNFWWWKWCLLAQANPLHSPMLFYPGGTDLIFHTHSPFNQIIAMPVNLAFGEAAAYNFCVILALTLTGFGTYLLVRDLTGSPQAGFLAGLVFAYFPNLVEQTLEHPNLFSIQFIPLSLFYLLRWSRSLSMPHALAFGACFALNALCSWHLGLKLALIVVPVMIWIWWRNRARWRVCVTGAAAAAAMAVLLVLPLLVPLAASIAEGSSYYVKDPVPRGIDASYLFTASYANPVFKGWVRDRYVERNYRAAGFVCYLGFIPLILAAFGVWKGSRRSYGWLALFLVGLILALGVDPLWDGKQLAADYMPFSWLGALPLLENLRVANRFMLVAGLGLAVMAGFGWKHVGTKAKWALPLTAVLILAEYSWLPYPLQTVATSPLLQQVADRPGAVLDIPFHQRNRTVHNMVAQTVHGRPIGGGYLATYPPTIAAAIAGEPTLSALAGVPAADVAIDVERLRELGFRTVTIHKYRTQSFLARSLESLDRTDLLVHKRVLRLGGIPDATMEAIRSQLDETLGPAALEDDQLAIYFL